MAITAVTSSVSAHEPSTRPSARADIAQREPTLAAKPSAITHISSEGQQRAALDRQPPATPAVPPAPAVKIEETLQNRANAQPQRRTAAEQANDAAVAVQAPAPSARRSGEIARAGESHANPVTSARGKHGLAPAAPPRERPIGRVEASAQPVVARSASANPAQAPRENRNAAAPDPATPAASSLHENTPTAQPLGPVPTAVVATLEVKAESPALSQTAKDFAAAFNAATVKRGSSQDRSELVLQAQSPNQPAAPSATSTAGAGVENSARRAEIGRVPADTSTFAVAVARNNVARVQAQNQGVAVATVTHDEANDNARNARTPAPRGEPGRASAAPAGSASAAPRSPDQTQPNAGATAQRVQNAQQNSVAPTQGGGASTDQGGLARHLNALANLLTP